MLLEFNIIACAIFHWMMFGLNDLQYHAFKRKLFFNRVQRHGFIIVITVFKKVIWSCKVSALWNQIRFYSYIGHSKTEYAKI